LSSIAQTLRFLGIIGEKIDPTMLQKLAGDNSIVPVYENSELSETTVGRLAKDLIEKV